MGRARRTLGWLAALLLALAGGAGALWTWSGMDGSLATALRLAAHFLPAGQTLQTQEVHGTLRGGGQLGLLRWQQDGLTVEARAAELAWVWQGWTVQSLQLQRVQVGQLDIDDQRPPRPPGMRTPPTSLDLPLQVDAPVQVDSLSWRGPPPLQATGLRGHYRYDGRAHQLRLDQAHLADGRYHGSARLLAAGPMTLDVQLQGELTAAVPSGRKDVPLQAQARLSGDLAGPDATLQLQAQLQPDAPASGRREADGMQASVSARLRPWQLQPVADATARWRALDLARLWHAAPRTELSGQAQVAPRGQGWHASGQTRNAGSGPWDQQRLPVTQLQAELDYEAGAWTLHTLQAQAGGGRVLAEGQWRPATATQAAVWQAQSTLTGVDPAALYGRLPAGALDGTLAARTVADGGLQFDADLTPSATASRAAGTGLRIERAQTRGQWKGELLTLESLTLRSTDASLQGQLTHQLSSRATRGQLTLSLPGAQGQAQGHLSAKDGEGTLQLQVSDAAQATRWLARWPAAAQALGRLRPQGRGDLNARWQGGWQDQGRALQLQVTLHVPELDLLTEGSPPAQAWQLRALQAELSGRPAALTLSATTQARQGTRLFTLQTRASGEQRRANHWQGQLETLQLQLQDSRQPGAWTAQLQGAVPLSWQRQPRMDQLELGAGQASLQTSTQPGSATLAWQPARWRRHAGAGGASRSEWHSQGQLRELPLAWVDVFSQAGLARLGVQGDMLLGGDWQLALTDTLQLRATLARTGGDLTVLTDDASAPRRSPGGIRAGVREARLQLTADGEQVQAQLRWDSESAGQAQAELGTRLRRGPQGWVWPADAPLAGAVRAQLPRVGAWSVLAPPGWRVRGTLDASADLSGTRAEPQWRGTLQASDLAIRSVVDGIEFTQGTLRASLNGQRLDIEEFSLHGASGVGGPGGRLTASGFAQWEPLPTGSSAPPLARVRMALDARADRLRVSARADRRLAVSGQVQARLEAARLSLRGALTVDQALFILPEDSAPTLGSDVVIRAPASADGATPAPREAAGPRLVPEVAVTLDLGPDFQLRGRGVDTRLAGTLALISTSTTALAPRLTGEVRTIGGRYKAYGQQLDIEAGVLRFSGPYDNPALDVLAIRPNLSVRVGVQISGTSLSPHVRLYADPEMADADKLAWLVLGRAAASGGTESAMLQQAALALLGGSGGGISGGLASALGLDELSVSGLTSSNSAGTATGATVTLGKRLSRDFYMGYERSLAGAVGTFFMFYDLSRRLTLRAQTGEQSAVDLIFTLRYD